MSQKSLLDLPVEVLHLICDRLDILTIVHSVRYICKHLYAVIDSYNRYTIDITSVSTSALQYLSAQIRPESVNSLIFSTDYRNGDQHKLFCSLFDITRFTRLQSLALSDGAFNDRQKFSALLPLAQVRSDFYIKEMFFLCIFVSR